MNAVNATYGARNRKVSPAGRSIK